MTKHILDRLRQSDDSDVIHAVAIAKRTLPQRATIALQRRERLRNPLLREVQYLRCARRKDEG